MVEVEAVATTGYACVGAFIEVETSPARGALVTAATNAGLAQRGALLAALPVIAEKATGALRHTHPEEREKKLQRVKRVKKAKEECKFGFLFFGCISVEVHPK